MTPSRIRQRAARGPIKFILAFVFTIALAIPSCMSQVKDDRTYLDYTRTVAWEDSLRKLNPRNRPVYVGVDLSLGTAQYQLQSNIDVLNNLPVNYFGGMAGGMLANPVGKLKGGIGFYHSGDNVPFTFDLLTANLSVNLYLLRIKEVRYHTWEPYILGGITRMKNKFYGHYLTDPSTKINRSTSEQPYVGSVLSTHLFAGAGVEYQLENDNGDFIDLYAEMRFGSNLRTNATSEALADTAVPGSLWITVGMSFGKFK